MRVLGISPLHDSSVAIINDGKVELFLKEERLTGVKRDGMPFKSLHTALHLTQDKIDYSCVSSPSYKGQEVIFFGTMLDKLVGCPTSDYSEYHHLSHASLAFYNSGFVDSLVFVIDRNGGVVDDCAKEAETVYHVSYPCNFKTLHKNFWIYNTDGDNLKNVIEKLKSVDYTYNITNCMSTVKIYESATTLIGEKPLENGKVMGLSAYGQDTEFVNFYKDGNPDDLLFIEGNFLGPKLDSTMLLDYVDNRTTAITSTNYKFYADYAYQVQKQTQDNVLEFVKTWVKQTGILRVCITGGYGLNVVSNENLVKNLPDVEFYFEPLADDSGNSIGAAMHMYRTLTNDNTIYKSNHTFFHGVKDNTIPNGVSCTTIDIAKFLANQKTVAVYYGLAEAGPRSLGHRSILFDARNKDAKKIVNKIKNREWYRPFAGMILEEYFVDYFETHGLTCADSMTMSFQCKQPSKIPGVVHVDNSCRVQTVNNSIPHINKLLNEFNKLTNSPILLNTSFNLAGKPLIETVEDAIQVFHQSDIDVLWFPEYNICMAKNV